MSILRLEDLSGRQLAEVDLGESDGGYFYSDNVYFYVDGAEYGSVFVHRQEDGRISLTLGQYDQERQEWVEKNPVYAIPQTEGNNP